MYRVLLVSGDGGFLDLAGKFLSHFNPDIVLKTVRSSKGGVEALMTGTFDTVVVDHDGNDLDYFGFMDEMDRIRMTLPSILLYRELTAEQFSRAVDYRVSGVMQRGRSQPDKFFGTLSRKITIAVEKNRAELERAVTEKRMKAIIEMAQMNDRDLSVIVDYALDKSVELTDSAIGYVSLYDKHSRKLKMLSWSSTAMSRCKMTNYPVEFNLDSAGIWGEPIRRRETVVVNDYDHTDNPGKKGIPMGHVRLNRLLMVPIILNGEVVGTAGVGNKLDEYTWFDEVQLNLLMTELFSIYYNIEAIRSYDKQSHLYDVMLSSGPVGMMVVSDTGDVVIMNGKCSDILGYRPADTDPIPLSQIRNDNVGTIQSLMKLCDIDGEAHGTRVSTNTGGTKTDYEMTVSRIMDGPDSLGYSVTFVDSTEIHSKDRAIDRAMDHIRVLDGPVLKTLESCRNELVRLPLDDLSNQQIQALVKLDEAVKFMNEYRDVGIAEPEWMGLSEMIEDEMDGMDFGDIDVQVRALDIMVFADPALPVLFRNLFRNSIEHGGFTRSIRISCRISNGWLYVSYSDDGKGVSCEMKDMIFNQIKNGTFRLHLIDSITKASDFRMDFVDEGDRTTVVIQIPPHCFSLG